MKEIFEPNINPLPEKPAKEDKKKIKKDLEEIEEPIIEPESFRSTIMEETITERPEWMGISSEKKKQEKKRRKKIFGKRKKKKGLLSLFK